jgi:ribosome-associated protein
MGELIAITDAFVIGTGTSRPHVQALADRVEEMLADVGRKVLHQEGRAEAEWLLLDYGDYVVHLFQPAARDFYALERLWRQAPRIDWTPEPANLRS